MKRLRRGGATGRGAFSARSTARRKRSTSAASKLRYWASGRLPSSSGPSLTRLIFSTGWPAANSVSRTRSLRASFISVSYHGFSAAPDADRPPTAGESQQAEEHGPLDHEVAARAREATELGAEVQGEGEIS